MPPPSYQSESMQKVGGSGNVDVKVESFQDVHFHIKQVAALTKFLTEAHEIRHRRRIGFLWMERRYSYNQADTPLSFLVD